MVGAQYAKPSTRRSEKANEQHRQEGREARLASPGVRQAPLPAAGQEEGRVTDAKPVLTPQQWKHVCESMTTWFRLRAKHEKRFADTIGMTPENAATQLGADVWHSALLQRMLVEGKDPLPQPPPRRNAYPDYAVIEGPSDERALARLGRSRRRGGGG